MNKLLGMNIDHVATLREQRKEGLPSIVKAAQVSLDAGADIITIHLREDRRHIQDQDMWDLAKLTNALNVELSVNPEMVDLICEAAPMAACIVPENREELTTEGGLDLATQFDKVQAALNQLQAKGTRVSLFIEPCVETIGLAKNLGADMVELHTGAYANLSDDAQLVELNRIRTAAQKAAELGLQVNAGHGLTFDNVGAIASIPEIRELHIGHSLVSESIFMGLDQAISHMKRLIQHAAD